eukprot:TRINITY_DN891_c0_g1_i2.p1 TRINITY_DN891_c0_g1~~TRINITY_DN891_c0_g1_i2.p1  ORF type:complete len:114 (-),score=34.31 TRINITY_DN891_c0_g1_i2:363-704(-)
MGRIYKTHLNGSRIYSCSTCNAHLAKHNQIISKHFQGKHGTAYLFHECVNVSVGPHEDRILMTGLHTVADIYCIECSSGVGWTYIEAFEESEKYKVGRFIIEKEKIIKEKDSW